jgi:hypothetical protein
MSLFSYLGCLIGRHKPVRRDVNWDGLTYTGHCRHCGAAIERRARNNWRKRAD